MIKQITDHLRMFYVHASSVSSLVKVFRLSRKYGKEY